MPLSRMENTTFAMPSIIDSHDMGLRTVYSPDAQKKTPIQRLRERTCRMNNVIIFAVNQQWPSTHHVLSDSAMFRLGKIWSETAQSKTGHFLFSCVTWMSPLSIRRMLSGNKPGSHPIALNYAFDIERSQFPITNDNRLSSCCSSQIAKK
ncbi:hypothetical protein TNCV_3265591 [Trichonephila clavipes]|nr:hypothetical protein TNCV_3265591 [Trichonephila clavipes]